jgi:hypothetical protein
VRRVRREEAVGQRVAYDVTEVVPHGRKRVVLRRGQVVEEAHLSLLARMGKEHLFVQDGPQEEGIDEEGRVHENDAAWALARAVAGSGVQTQKPREGKCDLVAQHPGRLVVEREAVDALNVAHPSQAAVITRRSHQPVQAGERVALARVYPRGLPQEVVAAWADLAPAIEVRPFRVLEAEAVVTGEEVAAGRVPEAFGPLLQAKLGAYGSRLGRVQVVGDDADAIARAVVEAAGRSPMVFVTGGMAVDPDDVTQKAIRQTGAQVEFAGVPLQPATLLLLARLGEAAVWGVPAGVLYDPYTALDLLLPWVLAGVWPRREEVLRLGVGGILAPGHRHGEDFPPPEEKP